MQTPEWSPADVDLWTRQRRNWGRWGDDDEVGAVNLIDEAKRLQAVKTVTIGRTLSLSRPLSFGNPEDGSLADMQKHQVAVFGNVGLDFLTLSTHTATTTHLDALNHIWDADGIYNGRNPDVVFADGGANRCGVDVWSDGIMTRGVLLDIPRFRGTSSISMEEPPTGGELAEVAQSQGVVVEPGDAVVIYNGRAAWEESTGSYMKWGKEGVADSEFYAYRQNPGPDISCLQFLRESDAAVVVWDMQEKHPHDYEEHIAFTGHSLIWAYGVALVDNARLEPLAQLCADLGRYEFLLLIAPLHVTGGTGSPVNPIAVF